MPRNRTVPSWTANPSHAAPVTAIAARSHGHQAPTRTFRRCLQCQSRREPAVATGLIIRKEPNPHPAVLPPCCAVVLSGSWREFCSDLRTPSSAASTSSKPSSAAGWAAPADQSVGVRSPSELRRGPWRHGATSVHRRPHDPLPTQPVARQPQQHTRGVVLEGPGEQEAVELRAFPGTGRAPPESFEHLDAMIPACSALPAPVSGEELTGSSRVNSQAAASRATAAAGQSASSSGTHPSHGSEHNCTATPTWFSGR